jgi:ABC-type polysaccharide/polyol phosphate export permease
VDVVSRLAGCGQTRDMTDTSVKFNESAGRQVEPKASSSQTGLILFDSDLYRAVRAWPLWLTLGWNDIAMRYRRSTLGPLWLTLSTGILVVSLGLLYSKIFKTEIRTYLPYLAIGFIVWGFLSSTINESCEAFSEGERIIKQMKVPFSVFVIRVVWRNFIVLMHTIILVIPIAIFFRISPEVTALLALPGLAILCINLVWVGLILAVLSTRFRDIKQIVASIMQIAIFATPVMWQVSNLQGKTSIADVNPLYHWLELVRGPLIGALPSTSSWIASIASAALGIALAVLLLRRVSRRIAYWL